MKSAHCWPKLQTALFARACMVLAVFILPGTLFAKSIKVHQGTQFAADLSPDGKHIVFDLQGTLWLMPGQGGPGRALTDPRDDARLPKWSPDGRFIAFQAYREDQWQIWISEVASDSAWQMTSGPYDHREPEWSADGRAVYFSSDRSGNYDIWRMDFDSARTVDSLVAVTTTPADEFYPAVSSQNQLAYFVREPGWGKPTRIRVAFDDGPTDIVSDDQQQLSGLSWLPDGQALSYVGYDDVWNASRTVLFHVDINTRLVRSLSTPGQDVFPFAASWINSQELLHAQDGEIQRINLADGTRNTIAFSAELEIHRPILKPRQKNLADPLSRALKGIYGPGLSADGKQLAFSALGDVWLQPLKDFSEVPTRLALPGSLEIHPSFSPDGKHLVYASDRSGNMDLWLLNLADHSHERLTDGPGVESTPHWSADGKSILFLSSTRNVINRNQSVKRLDLATGRLDELAGNLLSPGSPSLSPDGRFAVFSMLEPSSNRFREGRNRIRVINLNDGVSQTLQGWNELDLDSRAGSGPVWSAATSELVYVHAGNLWAVGIDSNGQVFDKPRKLNEELSANPGLNGTGSQVLYQSGSKIRTLDLRSGELETLAVNAVWSVPASPPDLLIQAGRIFDVETQNYRSNVDILIRDQRIAAIAERGSIAFDGEVIDARDAVVIPGLIDSHTHQSAVFGQSLGRLWLSYGVTSVREPGADPHEALQRKETWASGSEPGPRLFFTGPLLDGQGVYYGLARPFAFDEMLQQELNRALDLEYDLLKSYVRLPDRSQQTIIEFAAVHGLGFSSHDIYPAVAYGASAVEHIGGTTRTGFSDKQSLLNVPYQDVIALLSETGMTLTPTLSLQVGLAALARSNPGLMDDYRYQAFFDEAERSAFKSGFLDAYFGKWDDPTITAALERHRKELKNLVQAGARVTAGTDSPFVPFGLSLITELLSSTGENGLTEAQALLSGTAWAAEAMGAGDQLGRIEEGYLADLIIVRGDPLQHIGDLLKVSDVISAGRHFTVTELIGSAASPD